MAFSAIKDSGEAGVEFWKLASEAGEEKTAGLADSLSLSLRLLDALRYKAGAMKRGGGGIVGAEISGGGEDGVGRWMLAGPLRGRERVR